MTADNYDDRHIALLEALWGDGYLSPGGPEEVAKVVEGLSLNKCRMLDIGSGSGAIAVALIQDHDAAHVTGIDVEGPVCAAAERRVAAAGLSDRITIHKVDPGPLPFADATFHVVFSKDFHHPHPRQGSTVSRRVPRAETLWLVCCLGLAHLA